MKTIDSTSEFAATLYCRTSTTTAAAIDRYHSELTRLQSAGPIDELDVVTWPSRVDLGPDVETDTGAAYERFAEWADQNDVDLSPGFSVRSYDSELTGETGTALVTPVACLATHVDGELTAVYPHADGDTVYTVEDALELIQTTSADHQDDSRVAQTPDAE